MESLKDISVSLSPLIEGDSVKYISLDHGDSEINIKIQVIIRKHRGFNDQRNYLLSKVKRY